MGDQAGEIVVNKDDVISLLQRAYADEWLAYHQYWLGAKLIVGPMRENVQKELEQHATSELEHVGLITDRIIQLGGQPLAMSPKEWEGASGCGYVSPTDPSSCKLLEQNVTGERCAIKFYNEVLDKVKDDKVTYDLIVDILADEVEHEEDLQRLQEDLEASKNSVSVVSSSVALRRLGTLVNRRIIVG